MFWNSTAAAGCGVVVTHNVRDLAGSERFGVTAITPSEFLRSMVRELAKAEDVSINQLISTALAEKMSAAQGSGSEDGDYPAGS